MHAFSETRFTDKLLFTTGYSFTTLESDLSGYRVYGATYDPVFAQRLPIADTFENLSGGSELKQHVANLNLMWQLADSLVLIPSLRIEKEDTDSDFVLRFAGRALFRLRLWRRHRPRVAGRDRTAGAALHRPDQLGLLHTRRMAGRVGRPRQNWDNLGPGSTILDHSTDDSRFWQTYTVGANWYPLRRLNFGAAVLSQGALDRLRPRPRSHAQLL